MMTWIAHSFFWGPPSHKRIAWVGWTSGLLVVALAAWLLVMGHGPALFALALVGVGLANLGWGVELLPWRVTAAGWVRILRWLCALAGTILAIVSLVLGLAFSPVVGLVIAGGAVAQAFEFAPGGPANRA